MTTPTMRELAETIIRIKEDRAKTTRKLAIDKYAALSEKLADAVLAEPDDAGLARLNDYKATVLSNEMNTLLGHAGMMLGEQKTSDNVIKHIRNLNESIPELKRKADAFDRMKAVLDADQVDMDTWDMIDALDAIEREATK